MAMDGADHGVSPYIGKGFADWLIPHSLSRAKKRRTRLSTVFETTSESQPGPTPILDIPPRYCQGPQKTPSSGNHVILCKNLARELVFRTPTREFRVNGALLKSKTPAPDAQTVDPKLPSTSRPLVLSALPRDPPFASFPTQPKGQIPCSAKSNPVSPSQTQSHLRPRSLSPSRSICGSFSESPARDGKRRGKVKLDINESDGVGGIERMEKSPRGRFQKFTNVPFLRTPYNSPVGGSCESPKAMAIVDPDDAVQPMAKNRFRNCPRSLYSRHKHSPLPPCPPRHPRSASTMDVSSPTSFSVSSLLVPRRECKLVGGGGIFGSLTLCEIGLSILEETQVDQVMESSGCGSRALALSVVRLFENLDTMSKEHIYTTIEEIVKSFSDGKDTATSGTRKNKTKISPSKHHKSASGITTEEDNHVKKRLSKSFSLLTKSARREAFGSILLRDMLNNNAKYLHLVQRWNAACD